MDEPREAELTQEGFANVMRWWGIGRNRVLEDRVQRFQQLATGIHRAYSEACDGHIEALTLANECVTRSFQGMLGIRRPDELLTMETEALSGLMKATSIQMKSWSDFTQKVQGCYMDVARETTNDIGQEAREVASEAEQQVEQSVRTTRQRIRRAAREADDQIAANEKKLREDPLASTGTPQTPTSKSE
jgi:hypothetical protein